MILIWLYKYMHSHTFIKKKKPTKTLVVGLHITSILSFVLNVFVLFYIFPMMNISYLFKDKQINFKKQGDNMC